MALLLKNNINTVLKNCYRNFTSIYVNNSVLSVRQFSSKAITNLPLASSDADDEVIQVQKIERLIESKRNVSRLNHEHRNILYDRVPYPEPKADFHLSVKYRRKMYGKYGSSSGVNPGILWPTKTDIQERKEYESVAYPFTIQEMAREELSKKEAEEAELWNRQKKIAENLKKLDKWVDDLESRRAKKIKAAAEAKAKNDRLVEEVRRHFGYTVDPREERFQQMLELKRKEEKKLAKLERKKKSEEYMMQNLMGLAESQETK